MTIAPGTRFGPYEIVAPIGAGGMGEVFKARDTRLNRSVALKVLSADLAKTPQFKIRFSREAKAISQLSHPNICALYDIGDNYLVMELLEGETLADRLDRGPLPLPDVTRYGAQIAEALDRAHRAGIVHRDLKPGNIMITRSGVKLLDFGLAKSSAIEVTADGATATEQKPITQEGTIIGTLRYMAPEQLQGDEADSRTDIFAMGAVLYEMATGRRAFEGKSKADLIASILTSEPPSITAIQPLTPAALDHLVHTCLQKDREARFQNAHDVGLELGWVQDSVAPIAPKHRATRIGIPLWIAAIVVAAIGTWYLSRLTLHPVTPRFQRVTFHTLGYPTAVFSADQQSIVYSSLAGGPSSDIYVAGVGSAEMRSLNLPGATVLASARNGDLAVLLDPHYIGAYTIPGTLARVPLAGGTPRELVRDVLWADWSPTGDDLLILRTVDGKSRIEWPIGSVVYATTAWISTPRISPDAKSIAFIEHPRAADEFGYVVLLDSGRRKHVLTPSYASAQGLAWRPDGEEIWYTAAEAGILRSLWAVALSHTPRLLMTAPGILQLHDISRDGRVLISENDTHIRLFVHRENDTADRDVSWLDWSQLRDMSRDGRWVLFDEGGEGGGKAGGVYLRNTDGSAAVRLGDGSAASLSPDAKWALAIRTVDPSDQVYAYPVGPESARQITHDDMNHQRTAWMSDGKAIAFLGTGGGQPPRVYIQRVDGGRPRPISPEGVSGQVACSPDGRWVFSRGPDKLGRLYSVEANAEIKLPLTENDVVVGWSGDGKSLWYFRRNVNPAPVYALDLATGQSRLMRTIAPPNATFGLFGLRISSDGRTYAYSVLTNTADLFFLDGVK